MEENKYWSDKEISEWIEQRSDSEPDGWDAAKVGMGLVRDGLVGIIERDSTEYELQINSLIIERDKLKARVSELENKVEDLYEEMSERV